VGRPKLQRQYTPPRSLGAQLREEADRLLYAKLVWADIPEYPGYQASKCGQIARVAPAKTHATPRILKQTISDKGYCFCRLIRNGIKCKPAVHRLVLMAWAGPSPSGKHHGCHNDGIPANNHINNLRWDTCKNNCNDRKKHGTTLDGPKNGRARLSWEEVRELRKEYAEGGVSIASLSRKSGIAYSQIREILRKESWWPDAQI
jgi:hypothetical protein